MAKEIKKDSEGNEIIKLRQRVKVVSLGNVKKGGHAKDAEFYVHPKMAEALVAEKKVKIVDEEIVDKNVADLEVGAVKAPKEEDK